MNRGGIARYSYDILGLYNKIKMYTRNEAIKFITYSKKIQKFFLNPLS